MNQYLELLGFYPGRVPCLAVKVFRLKDLAPAIVAARDMYAGGVGACVRVQLSARFPDRRKVLLAWRSLRRSGVKVGAGPLGLETLAARPQRRLRRSKSRAW